jgi:hypothetical protein
MAARAQAASSWPEAPETPMAPVDAPFPDEQPLARAKAQLERLELRHAFAEG